MNKLAALLAAAAIAALPIVANAGAAPACADYTGDGKVSIADILFVVDHYQEPKGDGTVYAVADLLTAVQHYGESCS
jgi:hypothetical protein